MYSFIITNDVLLTYLMPMTILSTFIILILSCKSIIICHLLLTSQTLSSSAMCCPSSTSLNSSTSLSSTNKSGTTSSKTQVCHRHSLPRPSARPQTQHHTQQVQNTSNALLLRTMPPHIQKYKRGRAEQGGGEGREEEEIEHWIRFKPSISV